MAMSTAGPGQNPVSPWEPMSHPRTKIDERVPLRMIHGVWGCQPRQVNGGPHLSRMFQDITDEFSRSVSHVLNDFSRRPHYARHYRLRDGVAKNRRYSMLTVNICMRISGGTHAIHVQQLYLYFLTPKTSYEQCYLKTSLHLDPQRGSWRE